jgi:protein O-mannosyl-transferase
MKQRIRPQRNVKSNTRSGMESHATFPALDTLPRVYLAAALFSLAAICFFIYWPCLHYGFVSYDDPQYVSGNYHIMQGFSKDGIRWAFTEMYAANWHPITWLSHMMDIQFFGMNAGMHHLTNLLFHIFNTLLLFFFLYKPTKNYAGSLIVAALFAVHPLHVESVVWIAERKDVLSTFFMLLSLHAYLRYVRKPDFYKYLAVLAAFALGLMAKSMLVSFPIILFLIDFWPLRRFPIASMSRQAWRNIVLEKLPFAVLSFGSCIISLIAQSKGGAVQSFEIFPMHLRLANVLFSYVTYLKQLIWPCHLAAHYPFASITRMELFISIVMLSAITMGAVYFRKRFPFLLAGWFWYLVALVPVIGLVQIGSQAHADRYTYIPFIGIFIMIVWTFDSCVRRVKYRYVIYCLIGSMLIFLSRNQVSVWKDDIALWSHAVHVTTNNEYALTNLGIAYVGSGNLQQAAECYVRALTIFPNSVEAHNAYGVVFLKHGQLDAALEQCKAALRVNPDFAEAHSNLGTIYGMQGRFDDAVSEFRKALASDPNNPGYLYNLGFLFANYGKPDDAIAYLRKVLRFSPQSADVYLQLGNISAQKQMYQDALMQYSHALAINRDYFDVHFNMGLVLMNLNDTQQALRHFAEALRINPNHNEAQRFFNMLLEH